MLSLFLKPTWLHVEIQHGFDRDPTWLHVKIQHDRMLKPNKFHVETQHSFMLQPNIASCGDYTDASIYSCCNPT